MLRKIAQSRFKTAIAVLALALLFLVSLGIWLSINFLAHAESNTSNLLALASLLTAICTAGGTISTVILAWKADKRAALESGLKIAQLQQQIVDLYARLQVGKPD